MNVHLLSDLHLETFHQMSQYPMKSGDILILAGDILNVRHFKTNGFYRNLYIKFLEDCSKNYKHVLYVLGNHEAYSYNYEGTFNVLKANLPDNFHLMENDSFTIDDWTFLGCTLWTDFMNEDPVEMMDAKTYLNDYRTIRIGSNYRKMNPQDTLAFHKKSRSYLESMVESTDGNIFVITHHAPSFKSRDPKYGNRMISCYCSDLTKFILKNPKIKYFAHGHLHYSSNYTIGECNVISNPFGYGQQNTGYDPDLTINLCASQPTVTDPLTA
jgi:Icc-related predicted phosphoesterase